MTATAEDVEQAKLNLEKAIAAWVSIKVDNEDDADIGKDPILSGWIVVATYNTVELERADLSAASYGCGDQPAPLSRGLAMAGVDRWSFNR